jgi:hypothetical protein
VYAITRTAWETHPHAWQLIADEAATIAGPDEV